MNYENMTKEELIQEIKYHKSNYEFYRSISNTLEKKLNLLKMSITSFSAEDIRWAIAFQKHNKDDDLLDFFNKILNSWGRPGADGICRIVGSR